MLILLPPSEGKHAPKRGKSLDLASLSSPALTEARSAVIDALVANSSREDAAEVLGIGHTQTDLVELNAALRDSPTARADSIYTGVLFDHLGLTSLDAGAKRRATSRIAITSSVFGMVRPGDRIPAYRLSGGTSLPGLGGVAAHWRGHLGDAVIEAVGDGLLIDLRSSTYAAFWKPPADLRVATLRVLQEKDGKRTVVSHFNKATKGRIVRGLLEDGGKPRTPQRLAELLRDLGWVVEDDGPRLEVIVTHL